MTALKNMLFLSFAERLECPTCDAETKKECLENVKVEMCSINHNYCLGKSGSGYVLLQCAGVRDAMAALSTCGIEGYECQKQATCKTPYCLPNIFGRYE